MCVRTTTVPGGSSRMTSVSAYPQKSFITKKVTRKTVTINEIIEDEHEHARHRRAQMFHGKRVPKPKVRRSAGIRWSAACCLMQHAVRCS